MPRPSSASSRFAPTLVLAALAASFLAAAVAAAAAAGAPSPADVERRQALERLRAESSGKVEAVMAPGGLRVATLRGALSPPAPDGPRPAADRFLAGHAAVYGGRADLADLRLEDTHASRSGTHLRYRQTWRGLPVFDAGVDVHVSPAGGVFLLHNRFAPGLALDTTPAFGAAAAAERARQRFARPQGARAGMRPV